MDGELEQLLEVSGLNTAAAEHVSADELPEYVLRRLQPDSLANDVILLDNITSIACSDNQNKTLNHLMISRGVVLNTGFHDCIAFSAFKENTTHLYLALHLYSRISNSRGLLSLSMNDEWVNITYDPEKILYIPTYAFMVR